MWVFVCEYHNFLRYVNTTFIINIENTTILKHPYQVMLNVTLHLNKKHKFFIWHYLKPLTFKKVDTAAILIPAETL